MRPRELDPRKLVLLTTTVLGIGFILANIALSIILFYQASQFLISSSTQVTLLFGTVLYLVASVVLVILGGFLILGGLYSYRWGAPEGIVSLGVLLGSLYLLFLGIGSILLQPGVESMLLILSAVFLMVGAAAYMSTAFDFKLTGSFMTLAGGILLATVLFNYPILRGALAEWDVPFLGPFMSMNFIEGIVMILAPAVVFTDLVVKRRREESSTHLFLPIVTLIYGMSMFIGTLYLTLNLWNILWKSPWLGPLYAAPYWVFITTVFWSVALIILTIAGILLGISSFLVFENMVRAISVEEGFAHLLPSNKFQRQSGKEQSTQDKYPSLPNLAASSSTRRGYLFTARRKEEERSKKRF